MLLVQIIPFQLLIIPIYVMIVRTYGLADSYLGMIAAVRDQLDRGVHLPAVLPELPEELFAAARLDGASELRILWSIAMPLVRPALMTATLLTFIGPWNEFLWPFLVTKEADMQPLAVSLANYISNVAGRAANPYGAILAGAVVLAAPAVALFVAFQKHFTPPTSGRVSRDEPSGSPPPARSTDPPMMRIRWTTPPHLDRGGACSPSP